jgi:hypothetical protein
MATKRKIQRHINIDVAINELITKENINLSEVVNNLLIERYFQEETIRAELDDQLTKLTEIQKRLDGCKQNKKQQEQEKEYTFQDYPENEKQELIRLNNFLKEPQADIQSVLKRYNVQYDRKFSLTDFKRLLEKVGGFRQKHT